MSGGWWSAAPITRGDAWRQAQRTLGQRKRKTALVKRFPGSQAELIATARAATVQPKKLPAGVGLNWKPSWLP